MELINVYCPYCGVEVWIKKGDEDSYKVNCPKCSKEMQIQRKKFVRVEYSYGACKTENVAQ